MVKEGYLSMIRKVIPSNDKEGYTFLREEGYTDDLKTREVYDKKAYTDVDSGGGLPKTF